MSAAAIREALQNIIGDTSGLNSFPGKVLSVDEANRTCDVEPLNGDAEVFGVKLSAVEEAETGCWLIPKQDSIVIVTMLNKASGFVSMFSDVAKTIWKIEDMTLEVSPDGWIFNGGQNGGLALTAKVAERLQRLESALQSLQNAFNTHTHIVATTGTAAAHTGTAAPITAQVVLNLSPGTNQDYISNPKIKH